jgi:hypothetical protein
MERIHEKMNKILGCIPKQITLQVFGGSSTIKLLIESFSALGHLRKTFSTMERGIADNNGWH